MSGNQETNAPPMSDKAESVFTAILALPKQEQTKIVARLFDRLEQEEGDGLDESQNVEIARRLDEINRGTAILIPGDEAMRLFRQRKKV